ncbi:beta strand repeat-containing protein [Aquisphaera giovannonii]|uniref:beta strand repeat-containing protein n=1 Tax=Aquisphaera giovannonii TaxID=406548 RepID=UPI00143D855F|nr:NosD domain-containing protein [Aquisphaera giovannonii]
MRQARPCLFGLEPRQLLAVIPVISTSDVNEPGTLRFALGSSEPGDRITFEISTEDGGYNPATGAWTITVDSSLPSVLNSITIDGLTQQAQPGASTSHPAIEIVPRSSISAFSGNGLNIIGGENTVRGLAIDGFSGFGVAMSGSGADRNLVTGNFIGTDVTGSTARPNVGGGILVGSSDNTIGGTAAVERNLISGNGKDGILIESGEVNAATGNVILGNRIGTDAAGSLAVGNAQTGLRVRSTGNTVGGTSSGAGNLIAGNLKEGLFVQGGGNAFLGNFIGVDAAGTAALGNGLSGLTLEGSGSNTVRGNVLSGNGTASSGAGGIILNGSGATQNLVRGNLIGLNNAGTAAIPNRANGVVIIGGATQNSLGGTGTGDRNVISGNGGFGVLVQQSSNNAIVGNSIGTDAAGNSAVGNATGGIVFFDSSDMQVLGNLVSGNGAQPGSGLGIWLNGSGSTRNLVQGNYVGTNLAGTAAIPNLRVGVYLQSGAGDNSVSGNVISGNLQQGIELNGSDVSGNAISGNKIGLNVGGNAAVGNRMDGIQLVGASNNTIGPGNVISGNGFSDAPGSGVNINGSGAASNLVQGNFIGTDAAGQSAVPNAGDGIIIQSAAGNNTLSGNVVSGNSRSGIELSGADVAGNAISDNKIGLNVGGNSAVGNGLDGILVSGASRNTIGPGNVLSANGTGGQQGAGVNFTGSGATGNVVQGNFIGTDGSGARAIGNSAIGIFLGDGSVSNTVGPGNVVSGNGPGTGQGVGVYVFGATSTGNVVVGNRVGTDAAGMARLDGSEVGVLVYLSPNNLVRGNQVSGNRTIGIEIAGTTASGNQLFGNIVGLDATGVGALGNGFDGVFINDAPGNLIGGPNVGQGNFISANGSVGIQLFGTGATGNVVQGNAIGTDVSGQRPVPNRTAGIFVNTSNRSNVIGGNGPGQANVGQSRPIYTTAGGRRTTTVAVSVTSIPPAASKFRKAAPARRRAGRARHA